MEANWTICVQHELKLFRRRYSKLFKRVKQLILHKKSLPHRKNIQMANVISKRFCHEKMPRLYEMKNDYFYFGWKSSLSQRIQLEDYALYSLYMLHKCF